MKIDESKALNEMYPIASVATMLGVKSNAIRQAIYRGTIKGQKVEGRWFVERKELDRVLERRMYGGSSYRHNYKG